MKKNLLTIPVMLVIFVLWITPGLVGRDPWKADEPYTFGIVQDMVKTGDWVVPSLTGEPFIEKPPLYFMTAALFERIFSPVLDPFVATRLATVLYMFLALLFFALAAGELFGREHAAISAILLMGCISLQVTAHKLITDAALFAGFSIALYGLALARRRPNWGGLWLGTGVGIGFLSKGLIAPGVLGITSVVLPLLFSQWRRKEYVLSLAIALAAALPWLVIWPAALHHRSPELFVQWFWNQNLGRFLGVNVGSAGFNPGSPDAHSFYLLNLAWLAWPVVVPTCWSLWFFRNSWREPPVFQIPLVSFVVLIAVLSSSTTNRVLYALPLLIPASLIAVPAIEPLPARVKALGNWAAILFFGFTALVIWLGWFAMMTGTPAVIAGKLRDFQPDYVPSLEPVLLAAAICYSLAWLFVVTKLTSKPEHYVLNGTLGVILAWALIMTLWLPALNAGSSYRADFLDLKKSLPGQYSCVASIGLGESERAMLEYFTGLRTRRMGLSGTGDCDLLLEQRSGKAASLVKPEWQKVWEHRHPSTRPKDIFALYQKERK
jgi:4-amino-4-deoxy-L-arabinose transferase-like glycosyltransferase